MAINRFFSLLSTCFLIVALVLSGCDPQSEVPDPLPASLRVDAQPDSIITVPDIDFSPVSEVGQGPTGSLIRRNFPGAFSGNSDYNAYTYDEKHRLIGKFSQSRFSLGYDELILARYQGANLTETYTGLHRPNTPYRFTPFLITKYQYDGQHRLGQVLIYENVAGVFKLNYIIRYEYDATGQLQLSRLTNSLAYGATNSDNGVSPTELRYWTNGDYYRLETYLPLQTPASPPHRLFYTPVSNPIARLNLRPQYPLAEHYPLGSGPSASGPERDEYQYRYQYDAKGRLTSVQQRQQIYSGTQWTEWTNQEFVYAP